MTNIEDEQWITHHPDNSITLDAYAGMSREELKQRCRDLCINLDLWRFIAMEVYRSGPDLPAHYRKKLDALVATYED